MEGRKTKLEPGRVVRGLPLLLKEDWGGWSLGVAVQRERRGAVIRTAEDQMLLRRQGSR